MEKQKKNKKKNDRDKIFTLRRTPDLSGEDKTHVIQCRAWRACVQ